MGGVVLSYWITGWGIAEMVLVYWGIGWGKGGMVLF